jgi:hypothetical protein
MRPNLLESERTPPTEYSLLETVLLMAALSVLPLTLLVAAAMPAVALGAVASAAAVAVVVPALARLRGRLGGDARICVPGTEICARV